MVDDIKIGVAVLTGAVTGVLLVAAAGVLAAAVLVGSGAGIGLAGASLGLGGLLVACVMES